MEPEPLLALSPDALASVLGGPGRAQAVLAVLRRGGDPLTDPALAPGARARLAARTRPTALPIEHETVAPDGTVKRLLRLDDGRAVEVVAIPTPDRTTLCVSSQVGCARGCTFCLTATMGLVRSLRAEEIVAQVVHGLALVRERALPPLRNVVFMGMGEPLDNVDAVRAALALVTGSRGLGIGPRHVTVSTVGPSPEKLRALADLPARVAWSLHAAVPQTRARLVPTARATPEALRDVLAEVLAPREEPLFVELTLVDGVNDDAVHAEAVVALFRGFPTQVRLNLLPVNETERGHRPCTPEALEAFRAVVQGAGYFTTVRRARGADQRSACGQLAIDGLGRRAAVSPSEPSREPSA